MGKSKSYSELLRDPRWQKKRLEILNAAEFKCEDCGCSDKELQVHHCIYKKNALPWDYNGNTLMALCANCHEWRQAFESGLREWMAVFLRFSSFETVCNFHALFESLAESCPRYKAKPRGMIHVRKDFSANL